MPFLSEAIESIRAQTFDDWEMVVNDDASSDGSREYLRAQCRADSRIRLICNDSDMDQAKGLNRALQCCSAPWIARMDADDVALPQRFERQLDFVAQHPGIVATSTRAYFINARSRRVAQVAPADLATEQRFHERIREFRPIQILHSGALIRRDALEVIGGYRPAFGAASDMDLWMRLSEQGLVLEQQEHLMEYRIHSGSDLAARFRAAHQGTAWATACWRARGSGIREPTEAEHKAAVSQLPAYRRLNLWRRREGTLLYRAGGLQRANGRTFPAIRLLLGAAALRPFWTLSRLWSQMSMP